MRTAASFLALCLVTTAWAVDRDAFKDARDRYDGRTLRLRLDLKAATGAHDPNVLSLEGMHHPSERAPVLFNALETVYLERTTNEGGRRVSLTLYRSQDEANRLRASNIPTPGLANPNYGGTLATFSRQGSTSLVLELKAVKKDAGAQRTEIDTLLRRVFYIDEDPTHDDLVLFVHRHPGWPVSRLVVATGLSEGEVRDIVAAEAGDR